MVSLQTWLLLLLLVKKVEEDHGSEEVQVADGGLSAGIRPRGGRARLQEGIGANAGTVQYSTAVSRVFLLDPLVLESSSLFCAVCRRSFDGAV